MTVEPDAAPFAPRPAAAPRSVIPSLAVWLALILVLIALMIAGLFVVGPRLMAGLGPFHRQLATPGDSAAVASGEAPVHVVAATSPAASVIAANPPPSDVAGLQSRVATLEARQAKILDAATEALAVAALSRVADQPRPFGDTLGAFARALPNGATATLTPLALQGAPTRTELARSLDDLAARVAAEARAPAEGASLPARLAYALSRLVSIRRVDPAGSGPDTMIARAEIAANAGDIEGALGLLSRLPVSTTSALAGWRESARRRVAIDQAIAGLQTQAMSDLAVARSAPP
jgi:hypothetical protein